MILLMWVLALVLLQGNLWQHFMRAALIDLTRLSLGFGRPGCAPPPDEILSPRSTHGAQSHERQRLKLRRLCKHIVSQ